MSCMAPPRIHLYSNLLYSGGLLDSWDAGGSVNVQIARSKIQIQKSCILYSGFWILATVRQKYSRTDRVARPHLYSGFWILDSGFWIQVSAKNTAVQNRVALPHLYSGFWILDSGFLLSAASASQSLLRTRPPLVRRQTSWPCEPPVVCSRRMPPVSASIGTRRKRVRHAASHNSDGTHMRSSACASLSPANNRWRPDQHSRRPMHMWRQRRPGGRVSALALRHRSRPSNVRHHQRDDHASGGVCDSTCH